MPIGERDFKFFKNIYDVKFSYMEITIRKGVKEDLDCV